MNIIVINPGATSTKLAYWQNDKPLHTTTIQYTNDEVCQFETIAQQLDMRFQDIKHTLESWAIDLKGVDGIAARGGLLKPLKSGGYEINETMLDDLKNRPRNHHAANLGAPMAWLLQKETHHAKAYIYDPVTVDELEPISRISGLCGIERESLGHMLNTRAIAKRVAQDLNQDFNNSTYIVAHLGGGNTTAIFVNGRLVDLLSDDEGPFSTERTGALPVKKVIQWCQNHSYETMMRLYRQQGGLYSYLKTNDLREVQRRIDKQDKDACLISEAMAYQIAKGIGQLAVVNYGQVDRIVLTGGVAYSKQMVSLITKRVEFLAEVTVYPGEMEMEALYQGVNRILKGEKAHEYT